MKVIIKQHNLKLLTGEGNVIIKLVVVLLIIANLMEVVSVAVDTETNAH